MDNIVKLKRKFQNKMNYWQRVSNRITDSRVTVFIPTVFIPIHQEHICFLVDNYPGFLQSLSVLEVMNITACGSLSASVKKYIVKSAIEISNTPVEYLFAEYAFRGLEHKDIIDFAISKLTNDERIAVCVLLMEREYSIKNFLSKYGTEMIPYLDRYGTIKVLNSKKSEKHFKLANIKQYKTQTDQRFLVRNCPHILSYLTVDEVKSTFTLSGSQWLRLLNDMVKDNKQVIDYLPSGMLDWMDKDIMRGRLARKKGYVEIPDKPDNLSERANDNCLNI